jgi:hypothetical protein
MKPDSNSPSHLKSKDYDLGYFDASDLLVCEESVSVCDSDTLFRVVSGWNKSGASWPSIARLQIAVY